MLFEPDRESYGPGETITLSAQVLGTEDEMGGRAPVKEGVIKTQLAWQEPLPGDERPPSLVRPARARLAPADEPGWYSGGLQALEGEGYYQLNAVVDVVGQAPITLSELIVVEEVGLA